MISEEAATDLISAYVAMRRMGGSKRIITATPRQLESLIRLSEAHARMRLSETVEAEDVEEAERLMKVSMQSAAMDPETGTIDMDLITTGRSASDRERLDTLAQELEPLINEWRQEGFSVRDMATELRERMRNPDLGNSDVRAALDMLVNEGTIREGSNGSYRKRR